MQARYWLLGGIFTSMLLVANAALLQADDQVGLVSHIQVLSDKVPDMSSVEAWKKAYIKDGMSDKDKAMAVFNTMVAFENADAPPPAEFIHHEDVVLDPIKIFNVYGYSFCSVSSAHAAALGRAAGLKMRNVTINNHVVPEFFYDGAWHMMDTDLIGYFPKADGSIASAQEIVDGINAWLKEHPEFPQGLENKNKRYPFQLKGGWKNGPEILTRCPLYNEDGWLPCADFGWGDTMHQFAKFHFVYESGYSLGYQLNIQLRQGEKLTRNWSNKGLWVNMDSERNPPASLNTRVGSKSLGYSPKWGDLAPGRIGNGTLEYDALADRQLPRTALSFDNLEQTAAGLRLKDAAQPALLELRMPSSYVYLTGQLALNPTIGSGGEIRILFSDNNGLDWKDLATLTTAGEQKIDLSKAVLRHYDYRLRFVLKGAGTGLDALKLTHDIQHSQRPLPALAQGDNTITFSADSGLSTITYEASAYAQNQSKALTYLDYHAKVTNNNEPDAKVGRLFHRGSVTKDPTLVEFPLATPQDMKQLRIFGFWRTGSPRDTHWNAEVSFDQGKTFRPLTKVENAEQFNAIQVAVTDIPAGTRSAIVRYVGTGSDNGILLNYRIDADYQDPAVGFAPVKITYLWQEGGVEKKAEHIARQPTDQFTIPCPSTPLMKSIILERAQ